MLKFFFIVVVSKHSSLEVCRPVGYVLTGGKLVPNHTGKGKEKKKRLQKLEGQCLLLAWRDIMSRGMREKPSGSQQTLAHEAVAPLT